VLNKDHIELKNKIFFTLFVIIIYRFGTFIPIPGINSNAISEIFKKDLSNVFGMVNLFSGGALQRMSIFALNIMPYITSSIVIQLLTSMYQPFQELKKDGSFGRIKLNQYTKYLTIVISVFQALGVYYAISSSDKSLLIVNSPVIVISTVVSLVGGTAILMWLGEKITSNGIGNGISIIIFVGIISSLPSSFLQIFELSRSGANPLYYTLLVIILFFSILYFVCFFEKVYRKVALMHPSSNHSRGIAKGNDSSFLPIKINMSGVIPPIFASSVLMLPSVIIQVFDLQSFGIVTHFARGSIFYILLLSILIVFFCYFYSPIVFNVDDVSGNLKKSNCFIHGIRPGANTSQFLRVLMNKITFFGSCYLIVVCVIPEIMSSGYSLPISIGGTGILIVVNVVMDLISQVQSYSYSSKYRAISKRRVVVRR
jgi:preprotein translocase subunit SecY